MTKSKTLPKEKRVRGRDLVDYLWSKYPEPVTIKSEDPCWFMFSMARRLAQRNKVEIVESEPGRIVIKLKGT